MVSKSVNLSFGLSVDNMSIMLPNALKKIKAIPSYFYRNFAAPRIYSIRDRNILSKNLELKNRHNGQRCFLIGAGPSIAKINFSQLSQEYTFVVNEFEKSGQYQTLSPKFHIISESNYFNENGPEHWRNQFKEKDRHIPLDTTIILNLGAKPFVEKNGLFRKHQIYYVGTQGIFSNNFPFNIGLDKYVPQPKNSMLMCMMAAVWMGFNEIYLLGCEHSFLAQPMSSAKSLSWVHSYVDETAKLASADIEVLKKYIGQKELNSNYELSMLNMVQLFRNYRFFYAKARKFHPGLRIFNATPNSFLDVFPMINFEEIKLI